VTMQHLLTHVSGLPDQLAENKELRSKHASLSEFVAHAIRTQLHFVPGSRYQYSSMAILLAARVAELISGTDILTLIDRVVFQPLEMRRSAQGLGRFKLGDMVPCQTEHAAPEAGGGDPKARDWDWNSVWWRNLGAPWGGTHASAPDIARFLAEFLDEKGACLKPETAKLLIRNHNSPELTPRGLGGMSVHWPEARAARKRLLAIRGRRGRSRGPTRRLAPSASSSPRSRREPCNHIRAISRPTPSLLRRGDQSPPLCLGKSHLSHLISKAWGNQTTALQ